MNNILERTELLLGTSVIDKLKKSNIIIFGVGGVGGYVTEALVRSGVSNISIVDNDTVSPSNINRQIIATTCTIGKYKVDVMEERIKQINPNANVIKYNCFFSKENMDEFDFKKYDYIIDLIDSVESKLELIAKAYNENVKSLLKNLGIAYARTTKETGDFELPEDFLEWHPTCHHSAPDLLEKAKKFAEFKKPQYLKLFYVWGHSYEFDRDDNWNVIEGFCEYLSDRDDIWYATNIEIADYMKAARGLIYSADGNHIYNPYAADVWIAKLPDNGPEMGSVVKIPGGENVDIT